MVEDRRWRCAEEGKRASLRGTRRPRYARFKIGGHLNIDGRTMRVAGVLIRVGSQEDDLIYADLKSTQSILKKPGGVSMIEVSAWCKNCPIDEITKEVAAKLPGAKVSAVRQAARSRDAVCKRVYRLRHVLVDSDVGRRGAHRLRECAELRARQAR